MSGLTRWGGARLARRMSRSVPFLGAVIAVATVGAAIRRKGVVGGAVDTGLNALPFVGAMKMGVEWWRGRDLFPDRPTKTRR
ncbi:MAG: hypothetical protein LC791_02170 [Acidobacteria bacterium]|nr:hypothetical protein [Acidobacteriota bacterium]